MTNESECSNIEQASTPLEQEINAILNKSKKNIEAPNKELTPAEEQALKAMDLEEVEHFSMCSKTFLL